MNETDRRAGELAASLVGLSVEDAQAIVAENPGLTLRILPGDRDIIVTAEHMVGRINGFVRDGVVVGANAG